MTRKGGSFRAKISVEKAIFFSGASRRRFAKIRDRYIVLYLPVKRKIAVERAHPAGALCAFRLPVARQRFAHTHKHTWAHIRTWAYRARARTDLLPPRSRDANKAFSKLVPNCNIAWSRERSFLIHAAIQYSRRYFPCPSPSLFDHDARLLQDSLSFSISLSPLHTHVEIRVTRRCGREKIEA